MPTIINSHGRQPFERPRYTTQNNLKWTLKKQVLIIFRCGIPIVVLEYIIKEEICPTMHSFTAAIINGSYVRGDISSCTMF